MNEEKLKREFANVNRNIIDKLQNVIKDGDITNPKYKGLINEFMNSVDYTYCNCIGEYIASLFGIDRCDMLAKDKTINVTYARNMWWLAMRYMLRKSFGEIALISSFESIEWDESTINHSVSKINKEIEDNFELRYKWDMVKKLIAIGKNGNAYDNPFSAKYGYKIRVMRPKNVEVEVVEDKEL